jgi:hypothetical protein
MFPKAQLAGPLRRILHVGSAIDFGCSDSHGQPLMRLAMRPLLNAAVFGLVPVPCVRATFAGNGRSDDRFLRARKFIEPQLVRGRNNIRKRLATKDELAQLRGELSQIEGKLPA